MIEFFFGDAIASGDESLFPPASQRRERWVEVYKKGASGASDGSNRLTIDLAAQAMRQNRKDSTYRSERQVES